LEFVAIGTAITYDDAPGTLVLSNKAPFSSHLSGQDFVKLWKSGYIPTHFSFGVCVYHVAHASLRATMKQAGANVEMPLYTQAVYTARELAMERLQAEATSWQATGIVGTSIQVHNHVWGEHAIEFLALGTGIRPHGLNVAALTPPSPVLSMDK
jgi:uncharacterized protein YbjQ (UPF0145 family)